MSNRAKILILREVKRAIATLGTALDLWIRALEEAAGRAS